MYTFLKRTPKRVYLDYAAATPVDAQVRKVMMPYFDQKFANASAIHQEGVEVRNEIETARMKLARTLGIRPSGIVFTGSGTESNNLALIGVIEARLEEGIPYEEMEVLTTEIEHASITATLRTLANKGVVIKNVPVDGEGAIELGQVTELLSNKTVLVTVAYVNSEIGVVQNIAALCRLVRQYEEKNHTRILVHCDAAQAPLWLPCQLAALQVDMLSLDAGKCYGPKGVGVLAMRQKVRLAPYIHGGGQEMGLRSGTENTALIMGAVEAIERAQTKWKFEAQRVAKLRDDCVTKLLNIEGLVLNGSRSSRVANNINVSIEGVEAEFAVISLDIAGFAIATKSACSAGESGGSAVVRAITGDESRATTTLRITLGVETTIDELNRFVAVLATHVAKVRSATNFLT